MIVLLGTALAAAPGGYRVAPALPVQMASVRQAVVANAGGSWVEQSTLRGQATAGSFSAEVELPFVHTWERGWSDTGFGQLVHRWGVEVGRAVAIRIERPLVVGEKDDHVRLCCGKYGAGGKEGEKEKKSDHKANLALPGRRIKVCVSKQELD